MANVACIIVCTLLYTNQYVPGSLLQLLVQ